MGMLRLHSWYSEQEKVSSFLRKVIVFQKTCFKVKVLKTFKIHSDCHIKTFRSLQRWAILSHFFKGTQGLSICFKTKPLRRRVFFR